MITNICVDLHLKLYRAHARLIKLRRLTRTRLFYVTTAHTELVMVGGRRQPRQNWRNLNGILFGIISCRHRFIWRGRWSSRATLWLLWPMTGSIPGMIVTLDLPVSPHIIGVGWWVELETILREVWSFTITVKGLLQVKSFFWRFPALSFNNILLRHSVKQALTHDKWT